MTQNNKQQSKPKYISGEPFKTFPFSFDDFKGLLDRIAVMNLERQYLIWGIGLILFSAFFFVTLMTSFFAQFLSPSSIPFVAYFQEHPNDGYIIPLGLLFIIVANYGRWFGYKFMKHNG